jgi:hypothetical protein
MKLRTSFALSVLTVTAACFLMPDKPEKVAQQFWLASQAGDFELAESYVAESSNTRLRDRDTDVFAISEVTVGEATVAEDRAAVETILLTAGKLPVEITFSTALVRENGAWKVDLDQTIGEMTAALFGETLPEVAAQFGRTLGELLGRAVRGVTEGLREGLRADTTNRPER